MERRALRSYRSCLRKCFAFGSKPQTVHPPLCSSSSYASCSETSNATNKRNASEMNSGNAKIENSFGFESILRDFALGCDVVDPCCEDRPIIRKIRKGERSRRGIQGGAGDRRQGRKQKVSLAHDVSSNDHSSIFD